MDVLSKLLELAPPPAHPIYAGTRETWQQIQERISLPDELFEIYHRYGSGEFQVFDSQGKTDIHRLYSVFEKPILRRHQLFGDALTEENETKRLPVKFFPAS